MRRTYLASSALLAAMMGLSSVSYADTARASDSDHNKEVMERLYSVMVAKEYDPDIIYKTTERKPLYGLSLSSTFLSYCNYISMSSTIAYKRDLKKRGLQSYSGPLELDELAEKRHKENMKDGLNNLAEIGFASEKIFGNLGEEIRNNAITLIREGRSPSEINCHAITKKYESFYLPKLASHEAQHAAAIGSFARDKGNRLLITQEWTSQGGLAFLSVMGKRIDSRRICIWPEGFDANVIHRLKDKLPDEMSNNRGPFSGYSLRSWHDALEKLANVYSSRGDGPKLEPFEYSDCSLVLGTRSEIAKLKESLEARIGINMVLFDSEVSEEDYRQEKRSMDAEYQEKRKKWDEEAPARAREIRETFAAYETMIQWFGGTGSQFDAVGGRSCAVELRMVLEDARRFGGSEYAFGNAQAKSGTAPHCIKMYSEYK